MMEKYGDKYQIHAAVGFFDELFMRVEFTRINIVSYLCRKGRSFGFWYLTRELLKVDENWHDEITILFTQRYVIFTRTTSN